MNGKSTYSTAPPSARRPPVQDEWGIYDPNQAGLEAAFRALTAPGAPVYSPPGPRVRSQTPAAPPADENVQVRTVPEPVPVVAPPPAPTERGAVYALEFPTQCPQCCKKIGTVRVSRLLRTHVSFTSTLPRKGYIIVCPECDGILSAELSGLI